MYETAFGGKYGGVRTGQLPNPDSGNYNFWMDAFQESVYKGRAMSASILKSIANNVELSSEELSELNVLVLSLRNAG